MLTDADSPLDESDDDLDLAGGGGAPLFSKAARKIQNKM
jgi:hypothetical protein